AEVVQGDLTDLASMHRAIEGCARIYFGMSVSAAYLEATVNTAAVARHHGVEAFVNMSQMTVTQMSITETTDSPQHKLHWLAEQAAIAAIDGARAVSAILDDPAPHIGHIYNLTGPES